MKNNFGGRKLCSSSKRRIFTFKTCQRLHNCSQRNTLLVDTLLELPVTVSSLEHFWTSFSVRLPTGMIYHNEKRIFYLWRLSILIGFFLTSSFALTLVYIQRVRRSRDSNYYIAGYEFRGARDGRSQRAAGADAACPQPQDWTNVLRVATLSAASCTSFSKIFQRHS